MPWLIICQTLEIQVKECYTIKFQLSHKLPAPALVSPGKPNQRTTQLILAVCQPTESSLLFFKMPTIEMFYYTATTSWYTWLNYIHKNTDIQDTRCLALWRVLDVFYKGDWVECHDTGELYGGNFSQDDGKLRRVNCFFFSYTAGAIESSSTLALTHW